MATPTLNQRGTACVRYLWLEHRLRRAEAAETFLKDQQEIPDLSRFSKVAMYRPSKWLLAQLESKFKFRSSVEDLWLGEKR